METEEVIRKTVALAQAQLSNVEQFDGGVLLVKDELLDYFVGMDGENAFVRTSEDLPAFTETSMAQPGAGLAR